MTDFQNALLMTVYKLNLQKATFIVLQKLFFERKVLKNKNLNQCM